MSTRETVTLQRPSELEVAEFGITNKKWKNGKTNNTFRKQQKSRTDIDINPTFEYFQNKNPFRTS